MMPKREQPVQWAPRVRQDRLRRLYQLDAQGIVDPTLLDDVGFALYSRCQSILHVSDAMLGRVHCPQCDTIIVRQSDDPHEHLACEQCGWITSWDQYYATYRTQELGAGGAREIFAAFIAGWSTMCLPREKMVLIDRLIHSWHWETQRQRPSFGLGRPTGVNLIEGNRQQVLRFLNELTYGPSSTPELPATKASWRAHWDEVKARQAAGRAKGQPRSKADEQK